MPSAPDSTAGGMVKVHYQDSQEALVRAAGRMVTLIEGDRHIKEAASNAMTREMLAAAKPDKDHFLQHVIAMGDHEHYGCNKNADSFPKAALEKHHGTFVTRGHFFREHRNSHPSRSIGVIKASCYNAAMGRVELAVWGRLRPVGGFKQTAEEEYEMAKAGKALSYSMSCKVPNDRCNICGNVAPSLNHYCDHMRYHAGQYMPEHRKYAFVFNDQPNFFDISRVANPADRIAHHIEFVFHKAAATRAVLGVEAAAAEGIVDSLAIFHGCMDPARQALLEKLAATEELVASALASTPTTQAGAFAKLATTHAFGTGAPDSPAIIDAMRSAEPGRLFEKLARAGVLLPFPVFVAYASGRPLADVVGSPDTAKSAASLAGLFRGMRRQACCAEVETVFDAVPEGEADEVDKFMQEIAARFSIETEPVRRRVLDTSMLASPDFDCTEVSKTARVLERTGGQAPDFWARCYGFYKLSALARMLRDEPAADHTHPKLIACVAQNVHACASSVDT